MLTLLCRVKIKPENFKVDGKTSFYIIFYFKIMSQLWDTRFNEGGRHQSNSSVAVFSLSVNFDDNGSDLFIFSLPSPAVLFSACQRTWDLVPSEEAFHETTDMCIWEIYLILRTTVGGSQVKHTPCSIALNWPPERQIMSLRYLWWTGSLKSAWENSGISYRPCLLLFCVIFLYYIPIHRPLIWFPTYRDTYSTT